MIATVLAVLGTLAGAALTGWIQARNAAGARQDEAATERHLARRAAVVELLAAVEDHRRAMWVREEARLSGEPAERVRELRAASHVTRSAITRPHASVVLLAPWLLRWADALVESSYALRNAADMTELSNAREASVVVRRAYIDAAAQHEYDDSPEGSSLVAAVPRPAR